MKKTQFLFYCFFIISVYLNAQILPSKTQVLEKMLLANNYFMSKWPDPTTVIITDKTRPSNLWTRGTYYEGLMQLYYLTLDAKLLQYAVDWGTFHKWQPTYTGTTPTRIADNQCCGQTYLELYQIDPKPERIATMQASIDLMVNTTKVNDWWWIDAMHMAMPVFTKFGVIKNDNRYFEKMYDLYNYTKNQAKKVGLYNTSDHLWYRDSVYLPPKKSPNGLPVYWSRGNGWVIAALARTLDVMPVSAPHRDEYLTVFKEMMAKLITIQRLDGFWNVNLGDANDYGGKETSGTVFFTFGLAWGINNGHLDTATYLTPAVNAWNGLVKDALHNNGALGYVQSAGSKPADGQPLSYDKMANFEDFGLGGFLLAGSEIFRLAQNLEKTDVPELNMNRSIQAYPNPFTVQSGITFESDREMKELHITDIYGRNVYSVYKLNSNRLLWNGKTNAGKDIPSGLYLMHCHDNSNNKNLMFLKSE